MRPRRDAAPRGWGWLEKGRRARLASGRARPGRGRGRRGRARGCAGSRRLDARAVVVVVAREANPAAALENGDAAAALRPGHPNRVPHRAPLAGKIRDRHAARPALVDAPNAVLGKHDGKERPRFLRHQLPALTWSWLRTVATPSTLRATSSARCFLSALSTVPLSVTVLPSLSTSIFSVERPTSAASALFTLVVRVASLASCLIWSLVLPVPPLLLPVLLLLPSLLHAARANAKATD